MGVRMRGGQGSRRNGRHEKRREKVVGTRIGRERKPYAVVQAIQIGHDLRHCERGFRYCGDGHDVSMAKLIIPNAV